MRSKNLFTNAKGEFVLRKRTPTKLIGNNSPSEIVISLYTNNYNEACERAKTLSNLINDVVKHSKENNLTVSYHKSLSTGNFMFDLIASLKIGETDVTIRTNSTDAEGLNELVSKLTNNNLVRNNNDNSTSRLKSNTLILDAWYEYSHGKNQKNNSTTILNKLRTTTYINFLFRGLCFKDITYDKCFEIKESIKLLPAASKEKFFYKNNMTWNDISPSMNTISEIVEFELYKKISAFFNWAVGEAYIMDNYFKKFNIKKVKRKDVKPYVYTDLVKIFKPENYKQYSELHDERYWLPVIALYSGSRLAEIAQLEVSDIIKTKDGKYYFSINDNSTIPQFIKQVKNKHSKRLVPIHSEIIKLGFLRYLKVIQQENYDRVFPAIPKNSLNTINICAFSKGFSNYRKKLISSKEKKTFHSFRHTFITMLMHQNHPLHLIQQLVGHSYNNITFDVYGEPVGAEELIKLVECVHYDLNIPPWEDNAARKQRRLESKN